MILNPIGWASYLSPFYCTALRIETRQNLRRFFLKNYTYNKSYVIEKDIEILEYKGTINRRLSMSIPLNRTEGEQVLFIMMNPSKADSKESDRTINKIIEYSYTNFLNIKKIIVLNLYSVYETDSSGLNKIVSEYGLDFSIGNNINLETKNNDILELEAQKSEKIIVAWGKPKNTKAEELRNIKYHEQALNTLSILQNYKEKTFHFGSLINNLYPRHPLYLKNEDKVLNLLNFTNLTDTLKKKIKQQSSNYSENNLSTPVLDAFNASLSEFDELYQELAK